MKRALLALWLAGAIVYTPTAVSSESLEAASTKSEQAEVHSVVVDMPQVISLPPASPEAWDLSGIPYRRRFSWMSSLLQLAKQRKPALTPIRLSFCVNLGAKIRSAPSW